MVDTRSKALQERDKGKRGAAKDPPRRYGVSPAQSSFRENSMNCPSAQQFVTLEQLGEVLKQMQEAVIQGVCEKMKATEHQLEPIHGLEANVPKGIQALCKAGMLGEPFKQSKLLRKPTIASLPHGPSQLPTHPRAMEPYGMRSNRSPITPTTRQMEAQKKEFLYRSDPDETPTPRSTHSSSERPMPRRGQKCGVSSMHYGSPSMIELGHPRPPMLWIGGSSEKGSYKPWRYATGMTLLGKTLGKEDERIGVPRWASIVGRMGKKLGISIPPSEHPHGN
ncbi:hypothetical protein Cgig2_006401 [Carnegiea gigantea]|uniref:Uncharacterized protein n=1 Tax=Carnegiea gigantea TaxID=171969 RepID=A0A9Q1K6K4_9CARY|nr:hypothetical protein Cgig2_006401 [Carnegiea gigantea]